MNSRNNRYSIVVALACAAGLLIVLGVLVMTADPTCTAACR